jgi:uncharacterized coiled-coil protein SlyX
MVGRNDPRPERDLSRSNRRIQELEERTARLEKSISSLKDLVGTRDSTVADLVKLIDKRVEIRDSLGNVNVGLLKWVSNWNIGVLIEDPARAVTPTEVSIMFKGNLVMITPRADGVPTYER